VLVDVGAVHLEQLDGVLEEALVGRGGEGLGGGREGGREGGRVGGWRELGGKMGGRKGGREGGRAYHDGDTREFVADGSKHQVVGSEVVAPLEERREGGREGGREGW